MENTERIELLFDLAPHVRILDHKPGELRLKFSLSIMSGPDLTGIKNLIDTMPGIRDFKVNLLARNIHLLYDPEVLDVQLWESLFEVEEKPGKRAEIADQLREILKSAE